MHKWLFAPPVAFLLILLAVGVFSRILSILAFRPVKKPAAGSGESYACGEENYDHNAQPDYSIFFPFAFFFTLAHVATLIITTISTGNLQTFIIAAMYIIGSIIGLYILFRR